VALFQIFMIENQEFWDAGREELPASLKTGWVRA